MERRMVKKKGRARERQRKVQSQGETDIGFANILLQSVAFHSSSSASEVFFLNQGIKVMVCDFLHLLQIFVGDKVWH